MHGYKVTSKKNNNYIFLPAAGGRYDTSSLNDGSYGYYWSSQVFSSGVYNAWHMHFNSDKSIPDFDSSRNYGLSVRPVCP